MLLVYQDYLMSMWLRSPG